MVGDLSRRPVEVQEPRLIADRSRLLRDQFIGKVVVEIGDWYG